MKRFALIAIGVIGLAGLASAQGTPGGTLPPGGGPGGGLPANCATVSGDFTIGTVDTTANTIDATLTGDIDGALAGTIVESSTGGGMFGTISVVRFTATVTTATGTLEVTGRLLQLTFGGAAPPGSTPVSGTIEALKLVVTGGTGDFADHVGLVAGIHVSIGGSVPPWMNQGYHGVLCEQTPAPTP